ncbi:eukaryotic rRNA processing [Saccharata proteae CBS 121410]|uniref:Eukaryotic rRNA processing n=1 Tax=Saccharata proteae CBS 121410 TaxID=1314787 RepID=A0A9P4HWB8_9PEZI|nr:eukaryotic rRNA processing [Saccharata proteae CBS 121410]
MVKKGGSKLLNALKQHQGVDPKLETQKRLQKKAEKRKQKSKQKKAGDESSEDEEDEDEDEDEEEDDEDDEEDDSDSDSDSEIGEDEDDEDEEDIPLSDIESIASEEKEDVVPYQRLTINNTAALTAALHRISLPYAKLPFSDHQSLTSSAPTEITDTNDDLNRELAFYQQALASAKEARGLLKKEGLPFTRPTDYFAEMVKSDEHMGKIKQKLIDEAASKRASQDARRQRDLKKFGKAVQVAKLQERDKAKRDTMEKINLLKRKRQGADLDTTNESNLFDVALETAAETEAKDKAARRSGSGKDSGKPGNHKRQKKDEKFGFGGKKRFAKSNDAQSASDMSGYSVKKMKGGGGAAKSRPGKARRKAGH